MSAYNQPHVTRPSVGRFRYLIQATEILAADTVEVPVGAGMVIPKQLTVNGTLVVNGNVVVVS